jgi:hypothetical protein
MQILSSTVLIILLLILSANGLLSAIRIRRLERRMDINEGRRQDALKFFKGALEDRSAPLGIPRPNIPKSPSP